MDYKSINELISLEGKTALVTGSAMGIGKAIATRLHEAGANLTLFDLHHDSVHATAAEFDNVRGGSVLAIHGDVASESDVSSTVNQAIDRFGRIDILVNNAGIFPYKLLADMTSEDIGRVLDVNLKGVFLFTKYVSEKMKSSGGGKIINITSIDAIHPSMAGLAHYDASKHGVWGFTKNTALELADFNIWVNALAPGGVATPGVAAMQQGGADEDQMKAQQEAFIQQIPMRRMGDPDDIAKGVLFMASDLCSYMTGSQVVIDGGALVR